MRDAGAIGLGALLALAPEAAVSAPGESGMRDRSWQGVVRIGVAIDVRDGAPGDPHAAAVTRDLCAQIAALAAVGAPYPVSCISPAAAAAADLDTAVLAVQASVEPRPGGAPAILTFTVRRTMQAGLEPAPILFGAAPRNVPLDASAAGKAALDAALAASLAEVLPWRRRDILNSGLLPEMNGGN